MFDMNMYQVSCDIVMSKIIPGKYYCCEFISVSSSSFNFNSTGKHRSASITASYTPIEHTNVNQSYIRHRHICTPHNHRISTHITHHTLKITITPGASIEHTTTIIPYLYAHTMNDRQPTTAAAQPKSTTTTAPPPPPPRPTSTLTDKRCRAVAAMDEIRKRAARYREMPKATDDNLAFAMEGLQVRVGGWGEGGAARNSHC